MDYVGKTVTLKIKEKVIKPKVYGRYVIINLKELS